MTAAEMTNWLALMRARRSWNQGDCAGALGVASGQLTRWKSTGAPYYITLACAAISHDLDQEIWRSSKRCRQSPDQSTP